MSKALLCRTLRVIHNGWTGRIKDRRDKDGGAGRNRRQTQVD